MEKKKEYKRVAVIDSSDSEPELEQEPEQESETESESEQEPTVRKVLDVRYNERITKMEYQVRLVGQKESVWRWREMFDRKADVKKIEAFNMSHEEKVKQKTRQLKDGLEKLKEWKTNLLLTPSHTYWDGSDICYIVSKVSGLEFRDGELKLKVYWKGFPEPTFEPFNNLGRNHVEVKAFRKKNKEHFDHMLEEFPQPSHRDKYLIVDEKTSTSSSRSSDSVRESPDSVRELPDEVPHCSSDKEDTAMETDEVVPKNNLTVIEALKEGMPKFYCRGCEPTPRQKGTSSAHQQNKASSSRTVGSSQPETRKSGSHNCTCIKLQIGAWIATQKLNAMDREKIKEQMKNDEKKKRQPSSDTDTAASGHDHDQVKPVGIEEPKIADLEDVELYGETSTFSGPEARLENGTFNYSPVSKATHRPLREASTSSFWHSRAEESYSTVPITLDTIPGLGDNPVNYSPTPSSSLTPTLLPHANSDSASSWSNAAAARISSHLFAHYSLEKLQQFVERKNYERRNELIDHDELQNYLSQERGEEKLLARERQMEVNILGEQPMNIDTGNDEDQVMENNEENDHFAELPLWREEDFTLNSIYHLEPAVAEFMKSSTEVQRNVIWRLLDEAVNWIRAFPLMDVVTLVFFMERIRDMDLGLETVRKRVEGEYLPNASHLAVRTGNIELIDLVRGFHGSTDTSGSKSVLDVAFEEKQLDVFLHLLKKGASTAGLQDWYPQKPIGRKQKMMTETGYFLEKVADAIREELEGCEVANFFVCQRKDAIRFQTFDYASIVVAKLAMHENEVILEGYLGPRNPMENDQDNQVRTTVDERKQIWLRLNMDASETYSTSFAAVLLFNENV